MLPALLHVHEIFQYSVIVVERVLYTSLNVNVCCMFCVFNADPVTQENPSHVESPDSSPMKTAEEKRSIFQRSHSVGDGFSTEMCELLSLLWYHSITLAWFINPQHALLVCV